MRGYEKLKQNTNLKLGNSYENQTLLTAFKCCKR